MSQMPPWKMQVNLTGTQRLGILAAVAVSSSLVFMVYANKKHKLICGGPIDSPRHRFKCPLNFLSCGTDTSIATIMPATDSEADTISSRLGGLGSGSTPQGLSCPHNSGIVGSQMCLQCEERRFITILERSRMSQWSWCSPALSPATGNSSPPPHEEEFDEEPESSTSSYANFSSLTSNYGAEDLGAHVGLSCAHSSGPQCLVPCWPPGEDETLDGPGSEYDRYTRETIGRTCFYILFWYISTAAIEFYKESNKGSVLVRFPSPHLLQAFGFIFQAYFCYEVRRRWGHTIPPSNLSWTTSLIKVVPIAIASSFDKAIELPQGGLYDQFRILCKSGALLFVLILAYIFHLEIPTFKLTAGVASLTTGSLLTIAKALDQTYEVQDLLSLVVGAFISAIRWAGAQYLLQFEASGTPIATLGAIAPWMAIITFSFSLAFEPNWHTIRMHQIFGTWKNFVDGLGHILILYLLSTLEVVAELLLIAKTSAVTFLVIKLLKNVGELMNKIVEKGWYFEERIALDREKNMNEETIGPHYIVLGLVLFLWHRYQVWAQTRTDMVAGIQPSDSPMSLSPRQEGGFMS